MTCSFLDECAGNSMAKTVPKFISSHKAGCWLLPGSWCYLLFGNHQQKAESS